MFAKSGASLRMCTRNSAGTKHSSKKSKPRKSDARGQVLQRGNERSKGLWKRPPFSEKSSATTTHPHGIASRHREKFVPSRPPDQRHNHRQKCFISPSI